MQTSNRQRIASVFHPLIGSRRGEGYRNVFLEAFAALKPTMAAHDEFSRQFGRRRPR
jgi:hypothetical protein